MGAMCEFLERLDTPEILACYRELDAVWDGRAARLNERLRDAGVPVSGWRISPRYGRSAICSHRAITGCFSTICAPKTWP